MKKYVSDSPTYFAEIPELLRSPAIWLISQREDGTTGSALAMLTAVPFPEGTMLSVDIPHRLSSSPGIQKLMTTIGSLTEAGVDLARPHVHNRSICTEACAVTVELRGHESQFLHDGHQSAATEETQAPP